jgi:hypothetical protein
VSGKSFCGQVWVVVALAVCGSLNPASAQAVPAASSPAAQPGAEPASRLPAAAEDTSIGARSPGDLYKEARHPLEVVRRSLDNWSDAELGALAVGMHRAGEDCAQAKPADYMGTISTIWRGFARLDRTGTTQTRQRLTTSAALPRSTAPRPMRSA